MNQTHASHEYLIVNGDFSWLWVDFKSLLEPHSAFAKLLDFLDSLDIRIFLAFPLFFSLFSGHGFPVDV